ncbi:MAG: hypothetical protein R2795_08200 [Saprospiraceae bacterium]
MKLAYRTWNREHYVSDEVIKADLVTLSKGALSLPDDQVLENLVTHTDNHRRRGGQQSNNNGKRRSPASSYTSHGRRSQKRSRRR